ncbi:MAG: hypothetical protein JW763_08275 [candidate division Zixibacteria bacterium]|nr:hypothetical protein [candidate division Zixibacteria bacterium]
MLTLYRVFTFLVYYLSLPVLFWTRLLDSRKWHNRLGYFDLYGMDREPEDISRPVWLHASSMGEVQVMGILAERLRKQNPDIELFVTVMTETGYARACEIMGGPHAVGFLPLDYHAPIKRFLHTITPRAAVFIETEIWPNLVMALGQHAIPIFLANGRLSEKSSRRYYAFRSGLRRVLGQYTRLMVQSDIDRTRYEHIGAPGERVEVFGSLKFDAPVQRLTPEQKAAIRARLPFSENCRLLVAGSTRNGEHEKILAVFQQLHQQCDDIRLLMVPRHLDKLDAIAKAIQERGLNGVRYSEDKTKRDDIAVVLVDVMGILNDLYGIAEIAFVGGTLTDIGGHNILEPVWKGVPVVYGPSVANVRDSSDYIIAHGYGTMVVDETALFDVLRDFFAGAVAFKHKGEDDATTSAAARTARIILTAIGTDGAMLAEHNR